ncbi:GNAT family N-acetyltransferase [Flavobacterium pallidum]|uniref:N-acetyltransferase n=1 Tax=Flavobacterium pallidum TaxID=2172098 RepID=A0A2S1SF52_9FLAO|nr:GNAT family N-acetyltransferase [Flavobacterium pallidum]AWI25002.1 N-acetyltransferase [Flavobacterium pallidum]
MNIDWEISPIDDITAEAFFALINKNREHIRKTFPGTLSGCDSFEKTQEFIAAANEKQAKREGHYFYIHHKEMETLIGYICVKNIDPRILRCELAYFIDEDFEGQGIITKAVSNTIAYCFNELLMNKIIICTSKENTASQRIATKHGFVKEGLLRKEFRSGEGSLEDICYFGLLKSDYK